MDFGQLPQDIRVKLTEEDQKTLWKKAENNTIKAAAKRTGFSKSKIYNWKNKDSFIPAKFVKQYLDEVKKLKALKGGGRSRPIKQIDFPLNFEDELLTRIKSSVSVNKEGVPVYQTDDRGNAARFATLLKKHEVPIEVYNRKYYEIRYPKYIHQIAEKQSFSPKFPALVDEEGFIENSYVGTEKQKKKIEAFDEKLYSRSKRLSLALERENSEEIARLMAEESKEIRELIS